MTLEQGLGACLILLFLADVFLTVLYARAGTGLLAPHWDRAVWAMVRVVSTPFGRVRGRFLAFGGPVIVVALIAFWSLGLAVGAALVIHPELDTAIRPSSGSADTDFVTALLVAGNSLSIVGSGDYAPHTAGTRVVFLLNSVIGASVLSLLLSYPLQVYASLRERNALAMTIDLMTDGTGDAAVLLRRLVAEGDASTAISELDNLVRPLAATKEAHHFYPLLFYFRFEEPRYAVSRFCFVLLDLTTLIDTVLDPERFGALIGSTPVAELRRGALLLLETLDRSFPTGDACGEDRAENGRRKQRFVAATRTLADAGKAKQGVAGDRYVASRGAWEPLVHRVGGALGYTADDIDAQRRHPC